MGSNTVDASFRPTVGRTVFSLSPLALGIEARYLSVPVEGPLQDVDSGVRSANAVLCVRRERGDLRDPSRAFVEGMKQQHHPVMEKKERV